MQCATRLCSMEMLVGIISFSCKGQRWGKSTADDILLPKRLFPQCMYTLSPVYVTPGNQNLSHNRFACPLCSRAVTATPVEGLRYNSCPMAVHCDIPGHAYPLPQRCWPSLPFAAFCNTPRHKSHPSPPPCDTLGYTWAQAHWTL